MNIDVGKMTKAYSKIIYAFNEDIKKAIVKRFEEICNSDELHTNKDTEYLIKMLFCYTIIFASWNMRNDKNKNKNIEKMFNELTKRSINFVN